MRTLADLTAGSRWTWREKSPSTLAHHNGHTVQVDARDPEMGYAMVTCQADASRFEVFPDEVTPLPLTDDERDELADLRARVAAGKRSERLLGRIRALASREEQDW